MDIIKVIKVIAGIGLFVSFLLLLGIAGSVDREFMTGEQANTYIVRYCISFVVSVVVLAVAGLYETR